MESMTRWLVSIDRCEVKLGNRQLIQGFSWNFQEGQAWLVTGPSGGGKEHFIQALANSKNSPKLPLFCPQPATDEAEGSGHYYNQCSSATQQVSLEVAAALIQEERSNDEGDYIEGGIDKGRTAGSFICEVLDGLPSDSSFPAMDDKLAALGSLAEVQLCGVESVLGRGLKYLSTGEIRRVLLCRALLSRCRLLILSEPFAGLDAASRTTLQKFFSCQMQAKEGPAIILSMERIHEIPDGITHVLEFSGGRLTFQGSLFDYRAVLDSRHIQDGTEERQQALFQRNDCAFHELHCQQALISSRKPAQAPVGQSESSGHLSDLTPQILVDMKDVRVAWGDKVVLNRLSWQVRSGEHWLIRGPNGSGKTTLLELITGDNMQVFCNDVSIFGRRRGTGETIWELKERMGIVSYRLHLEYRMVGGTDIEAVLLSGFHDSVGLYQQRSQVEQLAARRWLEIGGFGGRGGEAFSSLSYGEQRAILILRAAVKCPPLLILDEPCHGLDEEQRSLILHLLETIAATGTTTLLHVTHDPTEVLSCEKQVLELLPRQSPEDDESPCYTIIRR